MGEQVGLGLIQPVQLVEQVVNVSARVEELLGLVLLTLAVEAAVAIKAREHKGRDEHGDARVDRDEFGLDLLRVEGDEPVGQPS